MAVIVKKKELSKIVSKNKEERDKAFIIAYELYKNRVYGVIYSYTQNKQLCEELMYQTFSHAYLNLDSLKSSFGLLRWLEIIARNIVKKEMKEINKQAKCELDYRDIALKHAIYLEFQDCSILDCLDEREKLIVTKLVIEEIPIRKLSKQINMPTTTIHRIYSNGITKLKEIMQTKSHL